MKKKHAGYKNDLNWLGNMRGQDGGKSTYMD